MFQSSCFKVVLLALVLVVFMSSEVDGDSWRKNFKRIGKPFRKIRDFLRNKIHRPIDKFLRNYVFRAFSGTKYSGGTNTPRALVEQDLTKILDPNTSRNEEFTTKITRLHNEIRQEKNLRQLRWDEKLASMAQKVAEKCIPSYEYFGDEKLSPYGQNIYPVINAKANVLAAIRTWQSYEAYYDGAKGRCKDGSNCFPFLQMIWKPTKDIGCFLSVCEEVKGTFQPGSVFVCFYGPI